MSPAKQMVAMLRSATRLDTLGMWVTHDIEGHDVSVSYKNWARWTCDGRAMTFTQVQALLESTYRPNHEVIPPLPKGDVAADTCPTMWVHSDEQLLEYARTYHRAQG